MSTMLILYIDYEAIYVQCTTSKTTESLGLLGHVGFRRGTQVVVPYFLVTKPLCMRVTNHFTYIELY